MQIDRILEKASRLGIAIDANASKEENLYAVADSLGIDNFDLNNLNGLENRLDTELSMEIYGDVPSSYESFGEREFNAARKEDGTYDSEYYKKRQEELDKKAEEAKKEKENDTKKKNDDDENSEHVKKNAFDKLKDDINLQKARKDQLQNKINAGKSKLYSLTHPEQMLKEKAKQVAKNASEKVKNSVKNVIGKGKKEAGKDALKLALKNPKVRIAILIALCLLLVLFIILLAVISNSESNNSSSGISGNNYTGNVRGLSGYKLFTEGSSNVKYNGTIMGLEEYISGVVACEMSVGYNESLMVQAIAARTYLVAHSKIVHDGELSYYDLDDNNGSWSIKNCYKPEKVNQTYIDVTNNTRGLIILVNGSPRAYYDASCMYTAAQARQADPNGVYSDNYYYLRFGSSTIDGIHFQEIEREKAKSLNTSSFDYYISLAETNGACSGNNGYGFSQNGARYLEEYSGYDWKQIIDYYYNNQAEIVSLYSPELTGGIFKQGDPEWGSIPLGKSSTNMARSGCAVTSIAIGIYFSGAKTTVESFTAGDFINALNDGNCFKTSGGIMWACDAINKFAPSVNYVTTKNLSGDNQSKIEAINSYSQDKYFILTHFRNSEHQRGHYVNFKEFIDENEYVARDPAPGSLTTQKISEIDHIVIYSYS